MKKYKHQDNRLDSSSQGNGEFSRCIFFHWDGARYDQFTKLLEKHYLPNVQKYLISKGKYTLGFTCLPSTTGPANLPYLAGTLPGTGNIPGVRWFERTKPNSFIDGRVTYMGLYPGVIDKHLKSDQKTLFDLIPKSIAINSPINRGAKKKNNFKKLILSKTTNNWYYIDQYGAEQLESLVSKEFGFIFANFQLIDKLSHYISPISNKTLIAYISLDKIVGKVARILENQNRLDDTLLIVSSDHGQSENSGHFNLYRFCKKFFDSECFPFPVKRNFSCLVAEQGNKSGFIYLKRDSSWEKKCSHEFLENSSKYSHFLNALSKRKELDLILTRDENNNTIITKKDQVSRITKNGKQFQYEFEKRDPLGIGIEGCFDLQSSFELTAGSDYPDILLQATQIFDSSRTSDIVVLAKSDYDFRESYLHVKRLWHSYEWPQHQSGHGGISKHQFRTPIAINYEISNNQLRSLDLYPTILKLLGIKIRDNYLYQSCV
ncbi:MAG: alkaline phosphatase family protein [Candidatus Heimdallarchaeota archaeon]|nr:MAG: alkaline phosphatase family protein [Candidatus Heimdallarchaeota archaeon]